MQNQIFLTEPQKKILKNLSELFKLMQKLENVFNIKSSIREKAENLLECLPFLQLHSFHYKKISKKRAMIQIFLRIWSHLLNDVGAAIFDKRHLFYKSISAIARREEFSILSNQPENDRILSQYRSLMIETQTLVDSKLITEKGKGFSLIFPFCVDMLAVNFFRLPGVSHALVSHFWDNYQRKKVKHNLHFRRIFQIFSSFEKSLQSLNFQENKQIPINSQEIFSNQGYFYQFNTELEKSLAQPFVFPKKLEKSLSIANDLKKTKNSTDLFQVRTMQAGKLNLFKKKNNNKWASTTFQANPTSIVSQIAVFERWENEGPVWIDRMEHMNFLIMFIGSIFRFVEPIYGKNLSYWKFPGFIEIIKALIFEICKIKPEDITKELTIKLIDELSNIQIINIIFQVYLKRTNAYNAHCVDCTLSNCETIIKRVYLKSCQNSNLKFINSSTLKFLNLNLLLESIRTLLETDNYQNLMTTLAFIYNIIDFLPDNFRNQLISDFILSEKFFFKFFLSSFEVVRDYFCYIVVFKVQRTKIRTGFALEPEKQTQDQKLFTQIELRFRSIEERTGYDLMKFSNFSQKYEPVLEKNEWIEIFKDFVDFTYFPKSLEVYLLLALKSLEKVKAEVKLPKELIYYPTNYIHLEKATIDRIPKFEKSKNNQQNNKNNQQKKKHLKKKILQKNQNQNQNQNENENQN
ncbi:hypothetical protein M0811_07771 [Anaeramoeba ignava]|uniref:Uncharacterized protein n=1 Tax=Anaeramoeba ignava TaxID=1746090 RepID=A0A9Q0LKC6_ANAIG|nr:hypothetical protein M0811_07771 [Anaeramoeba ignava]